ncbi:MAG: protein translocase subunit SecF [Alphaproteobacteria bacterium]|nr:MAG: protein translocase subunit SecF [Alphaproteobacteria bacterium]
MKLLKIVPEKTAIRFIAKRNMAFVLSGLLMILSVILFFSQGLNFGIDFRGGTLIEIGTPQTADIGLIRSTVGRLGLGDVKIQEFGSPTDVLIFVEAQFSGDENAEQAQQDVARVVKDALDLALGEGISYRRIEVVGPKVSGELVQQGILAIVMAVILMLIYIWFRFEWQFSLGAVVALVHDVTLTVGIFALTQLEFNLSIIAALLTIVGYSMNDTVVVYDRVRENLRKYKKMELGELLDLSINQTLSRTTMTSLSTLLALFSLYFFGGEVIRGFTFAMIWGVFVGTYSSIFVAAPLLLLTDVKREWSGLGVKTAKSRT